MACRRRNSTSGCRPARRPATPSTAPPTCASSSPAWPRRCSATARSTPTCTAPSWTAAWSLAAAACATWPRRSAARPGRPRWKRRRPGPRAPCKAGRALAQLMFDERTLREHQMSDHPATESLLFGRLTWEAIPFHEPILLVTFVVVALGAIAILGAITYYRLWGYLWREWFTSIDHKKIGIMYVVLGLVMLLRGFADALMMRAQQAVAFGDNLGYLPPHHYDQIFTAHGVIMIFFVAMPFITGLMNYVVPLQIGARAVDFPFLNNFSFWMTTAGALLVMASLFVGEFAKTGWLAYPPLSEQDDSIEVGMDYYVWALQIAGVGTTLSVINLIGTIIKMRAPGMVKLKRPALTWTSQRTSNLDVAIPPVLTAV